MRCDTNLSHLYLLVRCKLYGANRSSTICESYRTCNTPATQNFLTAVTEHESGIPGNYLGKAKRGFERLASNGNQMDFPQFEKVCSRQ